MNLHAEGVSKGASNSPLENFPVFLYNKKKTGVTPLLIEKELL